MQQPLTQPPLPPVQRGDHRTAGIILLVIGGMFAVSGLCLLSAYHNAGDLWALVFGVPAIIGGIVLLK